MTSVHAAPTSRSRSLRFRVAMAIVAPALILLLAAVIVLRALDGGLSTFAESERRQSAISAAQRTARLMVDQETGLRGYILTAEPAFLEPYTTGRAAFDLAIAELRDQVAGDPQQVARLEEAVAVHETWEREVAEPQIALVADGRTSEAVAFVASGRGKALVDRLRAIVDDFVSEEEQAFAEQTRLSTDASQLALAIAIVGPLVGAAAAIVVGWLFASRVIREVGEVTRAADAVRAGNLGERARVESGDEIERLAHSFNAMAERLEALIAADQAYARRLREQTLALEAANAELEAFSYSVSHDLRAPLRTIDGFGQILAEDHADGLGADGRRLVERMRLASQRMGRLIDGLLGLSRVSRTHLHRQPVDVSALSLAVVDELRRSSPGRSVAVEVEPGIVVEADPSLARIVLDNLIGNAWKFTAGTQSAAIRVQRDGADGAFVVRDNGAGFDPSYAAKLFQPFQRLHGSDEFPGTGIGLATVARIVRRHGGSIGAEGQPGRGAAFTVSFGGEEFQQGGDS